MRQQIILFLSIILVTAIISSCKNQTNGESKKSITTNPSPSAAVDADGNIYDTVHIGAQAWMKQNLKTTHYRDGSAITEVEDSAAWANIYSTSATTPAWCYYNGNAANNATYGKLYNWYAVTDPRNVFPTGYHVPTDSDWTVLSNYLGRDEVSGGHLKSTSELWLTPNTCADNSSGFTALPAGTRNYTGAFNYLGGNSTFWSSTTATSTLAWFRDLYYNDSSCVRDDYVKANGFSVRCVGD
jgi:uncharacterized protein (TIGR02145 family)